MEFLGKCEESEEIVGRIGLLLVLWEEPVKERKELGRRWLEAAHKWPPRGADRKKFKVRRKLTQGGTSEKRGRVR